jgi:hypothetical protein
MVILETINKLTQKVIEKLIVAAVIYAIYRLSGISLN